MDTLIKINDVIFIDLHNYYDKVDESEDVNIFEANNLEDVENYKNDEKISCKIEIKQHVNIFNDLVKDKHVNYDISKKFKTNKLDIIRMIQAINNSYVKQDEFHYTRLMMIICLKNNIYQYVNKYLKCVIKNYEMSKYKKEAKNFNSLIYSKGSGEIDKGIWNNNEQEKGIKDYSELKDTNFLFIKFLGKNISINYEMLENSQNTSKYIKEEEWVYLKEKILLLIKNSCVINYDNNDNFTMLMEFINKNMYRSFKRHKSIIEMKKFNVCLYFIDIFFNIFLIDYPYRWENLIENISNTFNFISIYKNNDLLNLINNDYYSTLSCITDLIKCNTSINEMENGDNNGEKDNYRMIIHFQNFYSLMFLLNKMLKKYIPRKQNSNSYSVLYHNYFISHIKNSNKDFLETEDYSSLKIPCENLLSGLKDIINIYFPLFNRLLCYLLSYMDNIYIIYTTKKIVKFLYKTLLCHFSTLTEELLHNELETLFTNIMKIIDVNLHEYVHKLYFANTNQSSNKTSISVAKMTEESSYENLSEFIHSKNYDLDRLFLTILLKSKKWCLKILNLFLYRSIHFEEMNETWKVLLKHFENKYIIFLEKIAFLILKVIINTRYEDEERTNYNKFICYIKYIIDFTDYLKYADKCLSLSLNYLCMIISFDHLQVFVKQNILSETFLNCLFIHISSSSHIECIDNFFTKNITQKEENVLFDNLKFERYIICFQKIPLYRKYLMDYYDDTKSKNVLKKYVNYIIFLFCELLEKYFYDIIFYLDKNVKDQLETCLAIQNEYMHVLYPKMFVKKEIDFSNDLVEISCYKKSNFLINTEMFMRTKNHNIYVNSVIYYISEIIQKHMKENDIEHNLDCSYFYLLNDDTFNNLIFIIKNLPLYKYSQDELIFKDLYSMQNNHNLNFSCLTMNDLNLYKYFSLFMFLTYYKYIFISKVLHNIIVEEVLLKQGSHNDECKTGFDKEDLTIDDYIEEYCKNKNAYKYHFNNDEDEIVKFDHIITDFKIRDKSFFLNYILVNIFHPYSNNLKRILMWMIKEYINMTKFSENILQFFFYICFINLFYFEKHLKFKSFDTLITLMYRYGIPRQIFYNDFREIFTFLFFQLLILFIKNESNSHDNDFYENNINVVLNDNYEKKCFLAYLTGNNDTLCDYGYDRKIIYKNCLYNEANCFTDFFINDVLYHNFHYYMEKIEENNLNQFLNFISLFYQNEINNNIFLFINLLNESLVDITSSYIPGKDNEYSFLKALKFFSFFLEHYKNASSTQDLLIIKILQNESFINYFKNIIRRVKKNQLCEETLNEIYYILYIFTKNSLFNYKVFWFYFLFSVASISNNLNIFQLKEMNKLEKIRNIPVYVFQFFNNVIKKDVFYIFFSVAEGKLFNANSSNISLIEILRKISLLLIHLSDENLNEQNFCNNSILHICGLYFYNNLLSYLFALLTRNKIFFTHLLWNGLKKAYDLIHDDNKVELSDMDDTISNYSFNKFDETSSTNKNCKSKEFVFLDDDLLEENYGEAEEDGEMEDDQDADEGEGVYIEMEEDTSEKNVHTNDVTATNYSKNPKSLSSDFSFQHSDTNDSVCEREMNEANWKNEVLFYREMKNYLLNKKKKFKKKKRKRNYHNDESNNIHNNHSSGGNVCDKDIDPNKENKIAKLLNTIYFNIFLLKDKKREHIRELLKTLKYVNKNLVLNGSENEYNLYTMLLMIQKKRYIYQSFSLYVFLDIKDFFNILVDENIFGSIIDEWINDALHIYQNSDDLKYFIFAFSNILIYICMYEQKKKMSVSNIIMGIDGNIANGPEVENNGFSFFKSNSNINGGMSNFDNILKDIDIEYFNEYAIEQLKERLNRIINAVVNVFLIFPIPYEENVKVFKKNILRRLAPICGEGDNIEDSNLLKVNSDNSCNDNLSRSFKEIHFNDLLQNIEFMHLNKYEQKFYERNQNTLKFSYDNVVHINKSEDLILYDKKISINYYFQNNMNDDFVNRLISECNSEYFKVSFYVRKAFSLLNQEFFSNDDLISLIGCSDKYYNFINIIRLDI
ncbi:hypothetical protein, conserved [Plasmodium gonderi]|uniref:Uncharacterized protein n=1 Tax=Plasmodium gonderi TaxID=77519 RepID=A0A1Y1JGH4_PLAGO|nr:hypothetical protein, conserved [Plasmodium gonderi]GAW81629.1 hypothetical protein, conserved [Plasmodium gonderi]